MKLLIVEDEIAAARRLQKLILKHLPTAEIVGICDSIVSSVKWLEENAAPDLIFMDIQLADGLSFEIFSQVKIQAAIIFTTAYDEYALRAFKVNSIDYLLKPIDADALGIAIDKYRNLYPEQPVDHNIQSITSLLLERKNIFRQRFLVSKGQRWIPVEINEIAWFVSEEKHVSLVTKGNAKYLIDQNLEQLEEQLDPSEFFRANRQFIIHHSSVTAIENGFNGKLHLLLNPAPEEQATVSREKSGELRKWLAR